MTSKKIKVPEGMLKAAAVAYNAETIKFGYRYVISREVLEITLEAALRWQRKNPPIPTEGETRRIWRETGLCNDVDDSELRCIAQEWIRRMYDAPEVKMNRFSHLFMGATPTHEEADAILEDLQRVAHGWIPKVTWPVRSDPPEPEIPEEIEDLLWHIKEVFVMPDTPNALGRENSKVIEAFRRGQKADNKEPQKESICPAYRVLLENHIKIKSDFLCPYCEKVHEAIQKGEK